MVVKDSKDFASIKLLARVFSLLSMPEDEEVRILLRKEDMDFELALFATYAH